VKIFSRHLLVEQHIFDRFEREVRVLQSLKHPNIVRFEEIVFTDELIYVVMEYCERGELYEFIANFGLLNPRVVLRIFKEITEAICFIHSRDIVHRDLKPENILLDSDMRPRLADFGLCHSTAKSQLMQTPCGSPYYACPEILSQTEYDGKAADIWSLGVVLFTMTTGELPWHNMNLTQLYLEIQECDVIVPDYLEEPIRALLAQMLSRNPAARPSAAQVLASRWFAGAAERPQDVKSRLPLLEKASTDVHKKPQLGGKWKKVLDVRSKNAGDSILAPTSQWGKVARRGLGPTEIVLRSPIRPGKGPTLF
jgi:serine/threonine protein kinase